MFIEKTINPMRAEIKGFSLINERSNFINGHSYYKIINGKKLVINISNNKITNHNLDDLLKKYKKIKK